MDSRGRNVTRSRQGDLVVSVVSCLPISRGTVAVAMAVRSDGIFYCQHRCHWGAPGSALGEVKRRCQDGVWDWMGRQSMSSEEVDEDVTVMKKSPCAVNIYLGSIAKCVYYDGLGEERVECVVE